MRFKMFFEVLFLPRATYLIFFDLVYFQDSLENCIAKRGSKKFPLRSHRINVYVHKITSTEKLPR